MESTLVGPCLQTRARPACGAMGCFLQPRVPLKVYGRWSHQPGSQQETGDTLEPGLSEEGSVRGWFTKVEQSVGSPGQ